MRLVLTLHSEDKLDPFQLSQYLQDQGIENQIEEVRTSDSKKTLHKLWIIDEDRVEEAKNLLAGYKLNGAKTLSPSQREAEGILSEQRHIKKRKTLLPPTPFGWITTCILSLAIFLFFWVQIEGGIRLPPKVKGLLQAPLLPKIERLLIFDYPHYFQLRDELFKLWTPKAIEEKIPPSAEAKELIGKIKSQPVWMGFYDRLLALLKDPDSPQPPTGPMIEKISEGQVWRLVTPALLHFDLLHIFFNSLWFVILGNQVESRLSAFRYLFLLALAAIVSNGVQYLISGPFFMGLSGIICALAAFIWTRQRVAPWEGYLLSRFTLIFLAIFILGMFALSLFFFFLQIFQNISLSVSIANGAHLAGALVGYLLGRTNFFAAKFVVKQ